jgi:hypothetical protein
VITCDRIVGIVVMVALLEMGAGPENRRLSLPE